MDIIKKAYLLSKKLHQGQTDRAGNNYFQEHVLHVFHSVGGYGADPKELAVVALLHDTAEDTQITVRQIRKMFGDTIADAVDALTRKKGEDYMSYVQNIARNRLARRVKIADLKHNMDLSRIPNPDERDYRRQRKYEKALELIT